ncbi:MAG: cyclomaltodextrinase N-terminal domain-containing protein, partial [Balneolaceae bacterium]|nr:cyclomaltodextrinase N-terminal domain-containing protein [Balneolaceae bacterium]
MIRILILFSCFILTLQPQAQAQIDRVDPPFWWVDMPMEEVQIQLYGPDLGLYRAEIEYEGVQLTKQIAVDSPNYLFLYLQVHSSAEAGDIPIVLSRGDEQLDLSFELKNREDRTNKNQGFDASD